ncbi:hypothetical protein M2093_002344 [Breznakia sp. PH1-1]|nr:hypothetical protein [Breznakia sp. PH1-1]MDH6405259.1 hypothetical protein [Breznakia sp. PF1-11]MDH6415335.1 hypothetical protein [Breznakia sp. PFB1-14]MDH6420006.1 hypothetical protein [Breznakia sp. PFB1-12]MDH6477379.1 hypothetical protein [Breznakia sp. PFB1-19]
MKSLIQAFTMDGEKGHHIVTKVTKKAILR